MEENKLPFTKIKNIVVVMTVFNRREYTLRCVKSIAQAAALLQDGYRFRYVVVDDKSTDGTAGALEALAEESGLLIELVEGTGGLYYSGGMRTGMEYIRVQQMPADYILLVNDDVQFDSGALSCYITYAAEKNSAALVGATRDSAGRYSYGGVRYTKGVRYRAVKPEDEDLHCDTFNANCVLIRGDVFDSVPPMDAVYRHSLGDFDYGLSIHKNKYEITVYPQYIGICNKNPAQGTWNDRRLCRRERIRRKEAPKGLPAGEWFHYLYKNFGFWTAVCRSVTPYVRILLGR